MLIRVLAIALVSAGGVANAQPVSAPVATVPAPAPVAPPAPAFRQITLAPNTEVVLTPNDTISTKSVKLGDKIAVSTVFDVMQDGYVLIPRGTPGEATVSYRTGTGAFGKSGKMEIEFNSLNLNGRHVPLTGKFRSEGEGNTGAAVGAVLAVGVFGAFVKGHSANITNGAQLRAHTVEVLMFNVPAGAMQVQTAALASAPAVAAPVAAPVAATAPAPVAAPVAGSK